MSRFRPSAAEERWLVVGGDADRAGGWRSVNFLTRCGLFVLGAMAAGLLEGLVTLIGVQHSPWFFALLVLLAAEVLIVSRRIFASGFEEALEVAGAVWLAFSFQPSGVTGPLWLLGGALGMVGLRLLNPLITTLGVGACIAAIASSITRIPIVPFVCYSMAALALAASNVTYRRPSYDRMLGWLMVVLPLGASVFLDIAASPLDTIRVSIVVCASVLGGAALAVGIVRRMHAPLLTCMVCALCLADEFRKLSRLPLEGRLIVGGSLLLLAGLLVDRYLRNGRHGITSRAVSGKDAPVLNVLELAGTQVTGSAALATPGGPPGDKFRGGGGTFSGGGAGGTF